MSAQDTPLTCLSMHQPWASLLVHGIKRIEGRNWPTNFRGPLWIHATAQVPSPEGIEELEAFYMRVHELDGHTVIFPVAYPTGVLLGTVQVVNCLSAAQIHSNPAVLPSLKLEVGSDYCFLCEDPKRLVVPQQMRGSPILWNIPRSTAQAASRALRAPPALIPFTWSSFPMVTGEDRPALERRIRALKKKLRETSTLQEQQQSGVVLAPEQVSKVHRMPNLQEELAACEALLLTSTLGDYST